MILVICFALAVIAFSVEILRFNFVRGIGGLLFVVGKAGYKDKDILDVKQTSAEKHARWSLPYEIRSLWFMTHFDGEQGRVVRENQ